VLLLVLMLSRHSVLQLFHTIHAIITEFVVICVYYLVCGFDKIDMTENHKLG